ncbi:mCG1026376, partial [Mus musculus]
MDQSCETAPIPPPAPLLFYKNPYLPSLVVESTVSCCVRYVSTRSSAIKKPLVV